MYSEYLYMIDKNEGGIHRIIQDDFVDWIVGRLLKKPVMLNGLRRSS